ncbi:decapping and exoribonuclease protein-like [Apostichopus japonicus]|uniref:decapping and exoribonuclease protein-like n=1 Tax=Stichopus japonicus TaxID=307972 RepID=UPI003AB23D58
MKRTRTLESENEGPAQKRKDSGSSHSNKDNKSSFPVFPHSRYDAAFPNFSEPREVGQFSLDASEDGERNVYNDSRKLKFYIPKDDQKVNFDLRHGYGKFIRKDDDIKERLDNLLRWVLMNKEQFTANEDGSIKSLNTDFLMWRGHLTKIICTPFQKDSWSMAVTLFGGTYYMSEVETAENEKRRNEMNEREKEMSYWGYKFEQYVTCDQKDGEPDTSEPVNNHDAFCSVVRSNLSKHRLLYGGEVDCIRAESSKKPPQNYVELKTSRQWFNPRNERNFYRFKLIKWWAQSFLVGIPEVICGFRDDDGVVKRLKSFQTLQMPRDSRDHWSGAVAFNFCQQFLSFVRHVVTIDDPKKVYLFERRPDSSTVTWRLLEDPSDVFLPDWFTSQIKP